MDEPKDSEELRKIKDRLADIETELRIARGGCCVPILLVLGTALLVVALFSK